MTLPFSWRVTKYNPKFRNAQGHYLADDWTSFFDVNKEYFGKKLTYEDYLFYETAYVRSCMAFLSEAGLDSLQVIYLENRGIARLTSDQIRGITFQPKHLELNSVVRGSELEDVIRLNLREVLWCKLADNSRFYLHFGWDYYMYIGSTSSSLKAIYHAKQNGLFVEEMVSPYL